MLKKEMRMAYKIRRDTHLKANNISSEKLLKLKEKRKAFQTRQVRITKKATKKRITKRNINTLSNRQKQKYNKQRERVNRKRAKLKYKKGGGDIAFKGVLDKEKWTDNFVSSNVWKFKVRGNNLMIMFLDGSVYLYFGVAKQFLGLYNVGSKGKWVWRRLRKANVNYVKIR